MVPSPTATKAEWRQWARTLPPVGPDVVAAVVAQLGRFLAGIDGPVLAYVALPDEIVLDGLDLPARWLPRLGADGAMTLHADGGRRERHDLGFEQPPAGPDVAPEALAAVLVPGRVFDRDGYRLGRGGGHYDRLLPALASGVPVIGVTVTARLVDRIPREPHDIPMTHLATEHGVNSTK